MSTLVVDLADPASIRLAQRVLDAIVDDWPRAQPSASEELPAYGLVDSVDALGSSQIDSEAPEDDPWATSSPRPERPRAASSGTPRATPDPEPPSDDDDPFS